MVKKDVQSKKSKGAPKISARAQAKVIIDALGGRDVGGSHERLGAMLKALKRAEPEVFWRVFLEVWNTCDATWNDAMKLLTALRQASEACHFSSFLDRKGMAFYNALPQEITIYRGCHRKRVLGLSWTTDKKVAEGFAKGHRGISVPDSGVFRASIPKEAVLAVIVDREESEVIVDPKYLMHSSKVVELKEKAEIPLSLAEVIGQSPRGGQPRGKMYSKPLSVL